MTLAEDLTTSRLRAEHLRGGTSPAELVALRGRGDGAALSLPPAADQMLVFRGDELVAAVALPDTAATDLAARTGLAPERLAHTFALIGVVVAPSAEGPGDLALAIFLAMRRHRMAGRTHYVAVQSDAITELLRPTPIRDATGLAAVQGRIDEAMLRCFEAMTEAQRDVAREGFVDEIRAAAVPRAEQFAANPLFEAARAGTLSRDQYVHSVANHHQLVRYTTRMLGLAVGMCEDPELRRHFAGHLSGEVNHEEWLEEDLAHLDADVDYVKHLMVPDAPILAFCFIPEALTSFRRDPVVFMGVPIAIEGAAAFTPMSAIEAIQDCVRAWGYDHPQRATRFLARHIHADAGDEDHEGHWDATLRMMGTYVRTERQLQEILRVAQLVFEALQSAYTGYVAQPAL